MSIPVDEVQVNPWRTVTPPYIGKYRAFCMDIYSEIPSGWTSSHLTLPEYKTVIHYMIQPV